MTRRRDCLMTPHFLIWSFRPKIRYVDGICHPTDSMNRLYLFVKTGPNQHQNNEIRLKGCPRKNRRTSEGEKKTIWRTYNKAIGAVLGRNMRRSKCRSVAERTLEVTHQLVVFQEIRCENAFCT